MEYAQNEFQRTFGTRNPLVNLGQNLKISQCVKGAKARSSGATPKEETECTNALYHRTSAPIPKMKNQCIKSHAHNTASIQMEVAREQKRSNERASIAECDRKPVTSNCSKIRGPYAAQLFIQPSTKALSSHTGVCT